MTGNYSPRALGGRYAFLFLAAAAIIALDQAVKAIVAVKLEHHAPIDLLGGALLFDYTRNSGAAFGILRAGGALFEIVAIAVSIGIVAYYPRVARGSVLVRVGLALILGGALGNLIDRIRLGYVIDFIDLRWWPVFNLADSAIVVGVSLLVLHSLLSSRESP